jgi:hypothetical protein
MTKFNEALLQSMLELVQKSNPEAIRVVSYEEVDKSDGYCETCYYEWQEVEIKYVTNDSSQPKVYSYSSDFADLIRTLTND